MFYTRVGQYVDVLIQRGEEVRRFNVKITGRPENEPMQVVEPAVMDPDIEPIKEKPSEDESIEIPFTEDVKKTSSEEDQIKVPSDVLQQPDS
jgi:hypothetical protein